MPNDKKEQKKRKLNDLWSLNTLHHLPLVNKLYWTGNVAISFFIYKLQNLYIVLSARKRQFLQDMFQFRLTI